MSASVQKSESIHQSAHKEISMNPNSRLAARFAALKTENRPALVSYLTAGDPDMATSQRI